jgi:hypothetical protein
LNEFEEESGDPVLLLFLAAAQEARDVELVDQECLANPGEF